MSENIWMWSEAISVKDSSTWERFVEGCEHLRMAGINTVVAQTSVGHHDVIREIKTRLPDMRIIPGVKFTGPPDLENHVVWERISDSLLEMSARAGSDIVLIDSETAIDRIPVGDAGRIYSGFATLPPIAEILWWPVHHAQQRAVFGIGRQACPTLKPIGAAMEFGGQWEAGMTGYQKMQVSGELVLGDKPAWGDARGWPIDEAMLPIQEDVTAIYYPGSEHWVTACRALAERASK